MALGEKLYILFNILVLIYRAYAQLVKLKYVKI